jgi:maltooligosyltrehalose synthase
MNPEPVATYRIQLRPGFGFEQAAEIVPYLSELGISHLYTSPCLQAASGSTHGYDVVDPSRVNEELGGSVAHARLCEACRRHVSADDRCCGQTHMAIKQTESWVVGCAGEWRVQPLRDLL